MGEREMQDVPDANDNLLISYLTLRRTLGVLGISLPFILAIGGLVVFKTGLQTSISDYYHTGMGDVFVGIIVAIGLFLASYTGYQNTDETDDPPISDNAAGNIACVCAVGLALFPTTPDNIPPVIELGEFAETTGVVHFIFAAIFFLLLAYFSFFLFTRTHPHRTPTPQKLARNRIYKICGVIIFAAIILIAAAFLGLPESTRDELKPVFWLEAAAVVAFGFSWLIKGETLWRDPASEQ